MKIVSKQEPTGGAAAQRPLGAASNANANPARGRAAATKPAPRAANDPSPRTRATKPAPRAANEPSPRTRAPRAAADPSPRGRATQQQASQYGSKVTPAVRKMRAGPGGDSPQAQAQSSKPQDESLVDNELIARNSNNLKALQAAQ